MAIPEALRHCPASPEEIWEWCGPGDADPPPGYEFGTAFWRQIRAHTRWLGARRAWAAEHGLSYAEVFHPVDPATGRRDWGS